jgi:DNA (cytosine-5)-methyltransferase 1
MGIRPTIISLFTGYGGLEMGLDRALGGTRTVCMVEREAFAIANLVAQMEAGAVAPAPIWTDVRTFDGRGWRPDVLVGGPPCQPFSTAGKRKHTDDERWIWSDVARIIAECRAPIVFLENVPGLRKRGLGVMLRDLAALGYDAEWGSFTAAEAGAPHRRTRLFLLAYADREQLRQLCRGGSGQGGTGAAQPQHAGVHLADPGGVGGRKVQQAAAPWRPYADVGDEEVADASGLGQSKLRQAHDDDRGDAPRHQPDGRDAFPPGPDDDDGWRRWLGSGGPQPGIRGGTHGAPDRTHRIRLLGNGVCPAQAALAFRELSSRAFA